MGVKNLWHILSPLCETKQVHELHGKTLAIDLSCWVVETQTLAYSNVQSKYYLANLYFRTVCLLKHGIHPVFVIEGKAPELKSKELRRRNNKRYEEKNENSVQKNRPQFRAVLKKCEELLKYLGLTCLQAKGEGEALCGYLNYHGLVDGCITQDSDCFLYGAKTIYKNFQMSANSATVEVYEMEKIERVLDLGRNKMIALALLIGCDYDEGVNRVGKESALKWMKYFKDDQILNRLKNWRKDVRYYERLEKKLSDPDICVSCGHTGKLRIHAKKGCVDCKTSTECNDSYKDERAFIAIEVTLRKKAMTIEDFPNQEIIDEFLICKDEPLPQPERRWKHPRVENFVHFMGVNLQWPKKQSFQKIFTLYTRWQLQNLPTLDPEKRNSQWFIEPAQIVKTRVEKGVDCFQIEWEDKVDYYKRFLSADDFSSSEQENGVKENPTSLITVEHQTLIKTCYPDLVVKFEEARGLKKKSKKAKTSRKRGKESLVPNRKLEEYMKKQSQELENSFLKLEITPKRKKKNSVKCHAEKMASQLDEDGELNKLEKSVQRLYNQLMPEDFPTGRRKEKSSTPEKSVQLLYDQLMPGDFPTGGRREKSSTPRKSILEDKVDEVACRNEENSEKPETDGEFDYLNFENEYVPLEQRVKFSEYTDQIVETFDNDSQPKFSIGFSALLNATEEVIEISD